MMKPLSITQAAKLAGVSRSTLYRYVKAGKLSRAANGKIDPVELQRAGFKLCDPEIAAPPSLSPDRRSLVVPNPDQQVVTTSSQTSSQLPPTSDVSLELIATLRDELALAREREHTIREAARQAQERLMILLAQEQCNVQQLLATGTSQPHRGFRDTQPRRGAHKGMAGLLLTVTSLFMAFLIFI
jgi:hypothetical protein